MAQLRHGVEGACTRHGYVLSGSVQLLNVMAARVDPASMNGDTIFNVRYSALVCNPPVGLVVPVRVYDSNMFAVFAQAGVLAADGEFTPLVDVILVKAQHEGDRLERLSSLPSGAEAQVVIVGKRFEIGDARISAVAQLLTDAEVEAGTADGSKLDTFKSSVGAGVGVGVGAGTRLPCFTRSLAAVLPIDSLASIRTLSEHEHRVQGPSHVAGGEDGQGLDDEEDDDDGGGGEDDDGDDGEDGEDDDGDDGDDGEEDDGRVEDVDDDEDDDEDDDGDDDVLPEDDASGSESG